jgi:hypothetical protein
MQNSLKKFGFILILLTSLIRNQRAFGQIANLVSNGGFEEHYFHKPNWIAPKGWSAIDSASYFGILFGSEITPQDVPKNMFCFQYPRSGKNYLIFLFYSHNRGYPRNRLKVPLIAGKRYCTTFYVNLSNASSYAISNIGAYFSTNETDTIKNCIIPLTYLNPQIKNPSNNIIKDTLKWVKISGEFVSNGNEKYISIGNFQSDINTTSSLVNNMSLPAVFSDYLLDDVSVIDIDLPAYAGKDKFIVPGDSAFIGRESDVGIDEACTWYKLPNDSIPIDTIAGFWIKPINTCTYMVRQEICGNVKWDTVILYENPVGIAKWKLLAEGATVYPNPANDYLNVEMPKVFSKGNFSAAIYTSLGSLVREENIRLDDKISLDVNQLEPGVYSLLLSLPEDYSVTKKFVISR